MRRLVPFVALMFTACGSIRTVSFEPECESDCETGGTSTTTTTGVGDDDGPDPETSGDGEVDTGDDDNDTGFVPTTDAMGIEMCDFWDPFACPEGEKCTAATTMGPVWDINICVPVMGDQEPGEPCMGLGESPGLDGFDDCEKGSMCWDLDVDTGMGYCVSFCMGSPNDPECPVQSYCAQYGSGVLALCLPTCDPTSPSSDCPDPNNLCIPLPNGWAFGCVLDASEQGTYGTECMYANSCNYGLFCAVAEAVPGCEGIGCCSEFCNVNDPNTCAGKDQGQECVPWFEEAPPGYEHVGGCAIPE